jgi:type II secretory pathway pseudopilin PulG
MKKNKKSPASHAMTLIELLLSMVIATITFAAISYLVTFVNSQIAVYTERFAMYSQINMALEDMRTRLPPMIKVLTPLTSEIPFRSAFSFEADKNIYSVTPDNLTDNVYYTYKVDSSKRLVLESTKKDGTFIAREVLVEAKYNPEVNFTRQLNDEPDILTIVLAASSKRAEKMMSKGLSKYVAKIEGVKFWFVDVKQ